MKKTKKALAILLTLALVVGLCAGCGQTSAGSNDDETNVLRIAFGDEPLALDIDSLSGGNGSQFVGWACYSTLWAITTEGETEYILAESYETSEDGLTITIHLRDTGFSNGDDFTAEDALFSLRLSDETRGDRTTAIDLDNSYAEDDKTLVLKMKQETPTFIDDLGAVCMISQSWTEDYTNEDHIYNEPTYSGAYYIESGWSSGQEMVLLKNEYYYAADELAYDEVIVYFVSEETTRYLSFENGEYDICYLSDSGNIDDASEDYNLYTAAIQSVCGIVFDTENENSPYTNENLRLAMMYAVDVEAVVEAICGDAYIAATSMLPSTSWAYKDETYGYDPDLAREYVEKYIEETGDENPTITLSVQEGSIDEGIAESVQWYMSEVGVDLVVDVSDFATFFSGMLNNTLYCYLTNYSGSSDPGSVLNSWNPDSAYTMFDYPDELADLIREACFTSLPDDERLEKLYEMQDAIKEFGKILPIYESTVNYVIADESIDITHSVQADGYLLMNFITVS